MIGYIQLHSLLLVFALVKMACFWPKPVTVRGSLNLISASFFMAVGPHVT